MRAIRKTGNFFEYLYRSILKYIEFYDFLGEYVEYFGEKNIIKNVILTLFSNARYQDYENPIQFLERYIKFFDDKTLNKYHNTVIGKGVKSLENGTIIVNNKKDLYGDETPYVFDISIKNSYQEYNLPTIN